jgi:hypothetical protein
MDEELIDYFFGIAQKEGFKKTREDFVKYVQTDDELFDYLYGKAQSDGYKKDKNHFAGLVGRGANQPVQEPVKTEAIAETVTEESPMAAKEPISMPTKSVSELSVKEVSEPTVEKVDLTNKEKADRLIDVTEAKKKAMAEDMSSKLMPVTENTQVKDVIEEKKKAEVPTDIKIKEVEAPSDKMVVKSEGNKEGGLLSKPIVVNGIKIDDDVNLGRSYYRISNRNDLHKLAKPKDITLDEVADKFVSRTITPSLSVILDKNISLNFPDPPNIKLKNNIGENDNNIFETKLDDKNVYSYYDDKNNKWYTYIKGSNKDNWDEVKSAPIKQMLNAKYKDDFGKIDKEKIFKIDEEEYNKIKNIKEHYYYNTYLPYLVENYEKLNKNQQEKIKSFFNIDYNLRKIQRDLYSTGRHNEKDNPDFIWNEKYDKFWETAIKKIGLDINLDVIKEYKQK